MGNVDNGGGYGRVASLVNRQVKNLLAMGEAWVRCLGWEDPLEKGMDRGSWQATICGISENWTQLSTAQTMTNCYQIKPCCTPLIKSALTNVDRKEVCFQSECPQSGEMVVSASPKIYLQRVYTALKAFKGKQRSYLSLSLRWGVRVVAIPHFMQAC